MIRMSFDAIDKGFVFSSISISFSRLSLSAPFLWRYLYTYKIDKCRLWRCPVMLSPYFCHKFSDFINFVMCKRANWREGVKECSAAKWHVLFLLQFHFDAKFMTTVKQLEMLNENEEEEGKKVTTFLTRWFVFAFVLFDTDSLFAFSPIYKQIQAACLKRKL